jgi:uncharacterized protein YegP (UPF0339 family)
MTTDAFIDKFAVLPESQHYSLLRKLGVAHIEKMAARLWTDYNVHDPGITTLEMLCYAITDLGYRTAYPVEDILAEKTVGLNDDQRHFYTARQIMPSNPVTIDDFRAVLIDVAGVKNAWLEIIERPEPQLFVDCTRSQLTVDPWFRVTADALTRLAARNVPPEILTALETIRDKTYADRKAFMAGLDDAVDAGRSAPYLSDLHIACAYAGQDRKIEPVFLQGLYDVSLELETEPELGNLNRFQPRIAIEDEDSGKTYRADVILPVWDDFFNRSLLPETIDQLVFGPLAYDDEIKAYRGKLQIWFETADPLEKAYRVVFNGPKTAANQTRIEARLQNNTFLTASYRRKLTRAVEIANAARARLHDHRSLCEDFRRFKSLPVDDLYVCADIEVRTEAVIENVLAEIYDRIDQFLSPAVNFYTVDELMARKVTADRIFEGPILAHGFIDPEELRRSTLRTIVRVSDLVQLLMDIEEVQAVKNVLLTDAVDGVTQTVDESWCLTVPANHAVRLDTDHSEFVFYKGIVPYQADPEEVSEILFERKALVRFSRLARKDYDLEIPAGQNRQIQRYRSIQNDFPLCYAIGREGLPRSADARRRAQAKQFKAYLLFFDQLLANYFAQLAHLQDLFSINPDIARTYYGQPLCRMADDMGVDVPDVAALSKAFVDWLDPANNPRFDMDDAATYTDQWKAALNKVSGPYRQKMYQRDTLLEDQKTYEDRRNRFLDHLMARFCEGFSDYVLLMYTLDRKKAPTELIADKLEFLADYPIFSRDRGKAFNYTDRDGLWPSDNVSGLKKRVSRLLGIQTYQRRSLADCLEQAFEIYQEQDADSINEYRFRLKDAEKNILLSSSKAFLSRAEARRTIRQVVRFGTDRQRYKIQVAVDMQFYFSIRDAGGQIIAWRIEGFATEAECEREIDIVVAFLQTQADCEGFHLVEHLLLRPEIIDGQLPDPSSLLSVCVDDDGNSCSGLVDPYSFRVTAVVPWWPERFQNTDFRRFFELTLREQAPAHVHVKICWVDQAAIQSFESAYLEWITAKADPASTAAVLRAAQQQMVDVLSNLRSVYEEVALRECMASEEEHPLLLDHSILGSIKKDQ